MTDSKIAGKAMRLAELVDYRDGSIVSRALREGDSGTMTLFAFAAGQGLSEHSAPFDAFVQILEGEATVMLAGKPIKTAAGDMVLMPANVPHALAGPGAFKMLLTMFRSA